MKKKVLPIAIIALAFAISAQADQILIAVKVTSAPVIDGAAEDSIWQAAPSIVTQDKVANIPITLKTVYTDKELFILVQFPDPDESRTHKPWIWDASSKFYKVGNEIEDVFSLKWIMEPKTADLSIFGDSPHVADVWFWKACRSDPAGYADDKIDRLTLEGQKDAVKLISRSGKVMYLHRGEDVGDAASRSNIAVDYTEKKVPRFIPQKPTGSRADIRAKGVWKEGKWTIELGRVLDTGNADDVQFQGPGPYLFGVSRYEIAGRDPDPELSQPLYGCGDTGEALFLEFAKREGRNP